MTAQAFIIKSLFVQNSIMLFSLGAVMFFLIFALVKRKPKHVAAALIWLIIVIWFFNSPFFGFSTVAVSPAGIRLNYGVLSFKNDLLPTHSLWKIETHFSDIKKMKKVYLIRIADHESMKVKGERGLSLLEEIGGAIENLKAQRG